MGNDKHIYPARGKTQIGIASCYVIEETGNPTASGVPLNKNDYTAANQTLPFGTLVRVVNLENGRDVIVKINDRGPFKDNRIIDLTYASARTIDMIQQGTVRVKIEIISLSKNTDTPFIAVFTVQVGSFRDEIKAVRLKNEVSKKVSHDVRIERIWIHNDLFHRVRVGRVDTRKKAERLSYHLRRHGYETKVIQE